MINIRPTMHHIHHFFFISRVKSLVLLPSAGVPSGRNNKISIRVKYLKWL
ncbi:hypothetical protein RchiOBHm_Chr4g0389491 [Rosa chinensis]|uniref:Uncharacterized protein n=1 Tax=Rosa chinensis TaxID=74649 RepID=A0A2P6QQ06_ROSCH|nr:hypothetical protein RchiOBHm_Chr4g0389491 [Rosa chinensis]